VTKRDVLRMAIVLISFPRLCAKLSPEHFRVYYCEKNAKSRFSVGKIRKNVYSLEHWEWRANCLRKKTRKSELIRKSNEARNCSGLERRTK